MCCDKDKILFEPIKIGEIELKHRIVMAPLTRNRIDDATYLPFESVEEYYDQRSKRPGTLVISEALIVCPEAGGYPRIPGIFNSDQISRWKRITDKVHHNGSFFYAQLWAIGREAFYDVITSKGCSYVSASAIISNRQMEPNQPPPRALTRAEIKRFVESFAQAARNAIEAGADGIEIHASYGYLFDQFLHENSNFREDEYGGSIENRARFLLETVDAVIDAVGASRVAVRLSPWTRSGGMNPGVSPIPQFSYIVAQLQARAVEGYRIAFIHVCEPAVQVDPSDSIAEVEQKYRERHVTNSFVRDIWDGVIIKAGKMHLHGVRHYAINDDPLCLAAIGMAFISNPDLVDRIEKGLPLAEWDTSTFYTQGDRGFIDYPFYADNEPSSN
ncbi:NADPH dehydrogenase 3 [Trichomonascus vanleenenianus]|uniref:alkene reductase n=1 Tax=Trichomonascus vanleenenianus TaxID=2268995 RepID=UPI003ECAF427